MLCDSRVILGISWKAFGPVNAQKYHLDHFFLRCLRNRDVRIHCFSLFLKGTIFSFNQMGSTAYEQTLPH